MESDPKKMMHMLQQEMGKSLDRISNLPKEIIDEILKRMPIRDAVKTSMLSTCWRYKWMSIMSDLVFDTHSILPSVEQANLVNFVYNVLLRHDGTIVTKFVINKFLECGCSDDVNRWIVVLSRKMLKELELMFNSSLEWYQLPTCVFSCKELTTLKLNYCILKLPSGFQGFRHLIRLELHGVCIANEAFETLVTKSPLLVAVYVFWCYSLTHVKICHAPNLMLFAISGLYESIKFCNTPNLKMVGLFKSVPGIGSISFRLDEVVDLLVGIHRVAMSQPFVELSSSDVFPDKLPLIYPCLKLARLDVNFEDSRQILAILCLFRSSPNLEKLEIKVLSDQHSVLSAQECFWESRLRQEKNVCARVKYLSMSAFKGMQHELGFVQFIMLNAVMLEYVTIKWKGNDYKNHEKLCIEKKMRQFKKASSYAEIRFPSQA
ncbi:F-box/FBD/LRR-repeat protein [Thalictrum thalictroides]|uniref:F-box/FBD/LRR-repeat protein n=1 Tax=Thalictrum thalictroides TaxID=46969 RepID=A0A7J6VM82_THATH|nr:F-box/FBD/LRR-repeat protein [Thalictrum thalictroides]